MAQVTGALQQSAAQGQGIRDPQECASPPNIQGGQAAATALLGQIFQKAPGADIDDDVSDEPLGNPTREGTPAIISNQANRNLTAIMANLEKHVVSLATMLRHCKSTVEQI